ncbi:tryptophan--tRNA ligase [Phenylobacterium aquaticum]|uniref:tryptophan--tRNA ligase n=1 Tax=Phenylobacterium aquaticum TaxID=1763816 RepID=UPI0026EE27D2|nr:tryptophan--tRNA ligase [Phenylobacterium aquaticum]
MTEQTPPAYAGPARVLSGVQPTGALHLGNYLGALVKFTRVQHETETFIFVADMHAITQWQDPKLLTAQVREITAAYLAAGLDPKIATIFPQSAVPAHAELAWVFNCVARLGWLDRMTQFKDKAGKHKERESVGLYTYPVLQAADILLYKATQVPVGEDQKQHVELTRDIAQKFNHDFEAPGFFPLPEAMIAGPGARIMSLRDGSSKMSKSDPSDYSRINLTDDADAIAQKVKKARTDAEPLPETLDELKGRAEALNLLGIYAALDGRTSAEVLTEFAGQGFGAFKPKLADLAVAKLGPVGEAMRGFLADPAEIDRILTAGAERAREVAAPTLHQVKKIVGFWGD